MFKNLDENQWKKLKKLNNKKFLAAHVEEKKSILEHNY
jgi:hypothetical protein